MYCSNCGKLLDDSSNFCYKCGEKTVKEKATVAVSNTSLANNEIRSSTAGILRVSTKSNSNSVAGAIAGVLRERGVVELQAIGAGAINQAIKAVAIARGFVAPSGMDLICIPAFADIVVDGEDRTGIKLIVEPR